MADGIVNAMSIDVEDYFHASALASAAPRDTWERLAPRVERNTQRVLDMLAAARVTATFFTLGCVAARFPGLVRRIAAEGHEVASHGYAHFRVAEQSPAAFLEDVSRTKKLLEDIADSAVGGYRAASFSIGPTTWWAYERLAEAGYRYSSSVNPVAHDHYGMPTAPRHPFRPGPGAIVELPLTTVIAGGRRFHASGGGYFRLLPYRLFAAAVRRVNTGEGQPAHFYFHPWEIDPAQPRLEVKALSRFRHYVNLGRMERKLRRLLGDFAWARTDRVYRDAIGSQSASCPQWSPLAQGGARP